MLMSKSRLEKFLYALYSLDSSDLPIPLSRIEELYKCWVTGEEAPSFEPISRVEKYLMAILGAYDVDSLPNPLSRVEVLLYKLAIGDDNLDDVKSFLSEHEELLAEIIKNGGAGGNINIEYVLYTLSTEHNTLYNTAEKPVKSAILKGNTLVNLVKTSVYSGVQSGTCVEDGYPYKVIESIVNAGASILTRFQTIYPLSPSTVYYLKLTDVAHTNAFLVREHDNGKNLITEIHDLENKIIKFTTSELGTSDLLFYQQKLQVGAKVKYSENFIISDDVDSLYNVNDYFEGMKSVQMPVLTTTGKNLFNINGEFITIAGTTYSINGGSLTVTGEWFTRQVVDLKPNTTYTLSCEKVESDSGYIKVAVYTDGTSKNVGSSRTNKLTFTTPTSFNDISVIFYAEEGGSTNTVTYTNIQLEEGSVATEYESFKSNILTVNEEVELRGIGDVKDELNLLTGELTTRTREVVYNSANITIGKYRNKENTFNLLFDDKSPDTRSIMVDKIPVMLWSSFTGNFDLSCSSLSNSYIYMTIPNANTPEEAKTYLSNLNPTFIYILAEESIKTVDLSVVNQDGNNTELKTFNDITYVTLSSEGLIPEAELEVATKNEEVLNTMSLEMDDISTAQTTLEETSNAQSENVDATMIATTEIYEGLL